MIRIDIASIMIIIIVPDATNARLFTKIHLLMNHIIIIIIFLVVAGVT